MIKVQIGNLIYWYSTEKFMREAANTMNAPTKMLLAEIVYNTTTNEFLKNRYGLEYMADCVMKHIED